MGNTSRFHSRKSKPPKEALHLALTPITRSDGWPGLAIFRE
jgi:hypothetical protein